MSFPNSSSRFKKVLPLLVALAILASLSLFTWQSLGAATMATHVQTINSDQEIKLARNLTQSEPTEILRDLRPFTESETEETNTEVSQLQPDSNPSLSDIEPSQIIDTSTPFDNLWFGGKEGGHEYVDIVYEPQQITETPPLTTQNYPIESPYVIPMGFTGTSLDLDSPYGAMNPGESFTVTFDSPPDTTLMDSMQFYPNPIDFTYTINGSTVTITPQERMNRSTEYSFGLKTVGICAGNNCGTSELWLYRVTFKTSQYERLVYGQSVQGRDLVAHIFGPANVTGKRIMLTGATHGEEWHAGDLQSLVNYLKANPQEMFNRNKKLVIIPRVNADGAWRNETFNDYSTLARYNARGVNLNRNFPTSWLPCGICGSGPASEPETQGVINMTYQENITHMIAYHNQWPPYGIIFLGDNDNAYTVWWAQWVSDRTGYPVGIFDGPETDQSESGDVPGDQVVWAENVNVRGLLIEGTYRGVTDWDKNFPMYLALIREF
jgi:hypothetical protein